MSKYPRLTTLQANALAGDLVRELAHHIGDADGVAEVFTRWTRVLGQTSFATVCVAATRITFRDCLTQTPIADVPAGAIAFAEEKTA